MSPDRWREIETLYNEVADLPADAQQERLAGIGDAELVREVRSLLGSGSAKSMVVSAVAAVAGSAAAGPPVPQRFGPWRVTGVAGHGGMGAVYQAVRDDRAFDKHVAIKVLHLGLDSAPGRERFQQERSILAGLEHPNIARLPDGGETETGVSYIVMEYVDGEPIVDYCVRRKLPREARLQLFLQVCSAVHLAHQRLVVHRDLKPGNILVTREGVPKLLDFGTAKLMEPSALRTMTGFLALTPQYASPEQIRGEPVSTATDVYSLGMVLYEMLAERRPYEVDATTMTGIARTVCEVQPAPPRLDPDLDNILLMALRKEPARRYASAQAFADDVERALANRPVAARPASFGYRASKFARRNWLPLAAAAAVLAALGGGAFAALQQARIARGRFDQVRKLARSFVFDYYDDLARIEGTTATREKMVRTALEYLDNLAANAGSDFELQKELAGAYQKVGEAPGYPTRPSLGKTADAIVSYGKAFEIHERLAALDQRHRAEAGKFYVDFASVLRYSHDYDRASRVAEAALRSAELSARERPDDKAAQIDAGRAWRLLGDLDEDLGRYSTALEKNGKCDEASRAALLAQFRADAYYDDQQPSLEDPVHALPHARRYLELARQMVAKDPNSASARLSHAIAHYRGAFVLRRIDPPAAVAAARESVRLFDRDVAEGRTGYLIVSRRQRALRRLAEALLSAGEAEAAAGRLLAEAEQLGGRVQGPPLALARAAAARLEGTR